MSIHNKSLFPHIGPLLPELQPGALMNMTNALPTSGLGVLAASPGIMEMFTQAMPTMPTMPEDKFDPRGALIGGGLMDLADIIMKREPQNRGQELYKNARAMYDRDRQLKYQNALAQYQGAQQNFQNTLGVGQLMATLAKDTSPNDVKLMKAFGLDPNNPEDVKKFYASKNQGKGTNISVDASQKANVKLNEKRADNAAKYEAELDAIVAGAPQTQDIISQMEILNAGIDTSGNVGDLADGINRLLGSLGSDTRISADTQWREAFRGLSNKLALGELQFFKGPTTDFEFLVAASIAGNLDQTPEGRELLLMLAKGRSMMNQVGAQAYLDWAYSYDGIPSAGKFTKSDAYKQLQLKTQYSLNPGSLGKILAALPEDKYRDLYNKRKAEMTKRYKNAYPDEADAEILKMVNQHMDLELGN